MTQSEKVFESRTLSDFLALPPVLFIVVILALMHTNSNLINKQEPINSHPSIENMV